MKSVLIATPLEAFNTSLSKALESNYRIHTCSAGTECLALIDQLHPDILILYLSLPAMDGLSILNQATYKPRISLGLTNLVTEKIVLKAESLGIKGLILIPCSTSHVVNRLEQLAKNSNPSPK